MRYGSVRSNPIQHFNKNICIGVLFNVIAKTNSQNSKRIDLYTRDN